MKKISIAEIFMSVQGEGSQAGEIALFIRLAGCNFWSGLENKREQGVGECALWCDTDFLPKYKLSIEEISERIDRYKQKNKSPLPLVIFTGGEPTLQLHHLSDLIASKIETTRISVETNGSKDCQVLKFLSQHKNGHVVCSPKKSNKPLKLRQCNDLKIIVQPTGITKINQLIEYDMLYFQPCDLGQGGKKSIDATIQAALHHGAKLSFQTHKYLGLR